jgi:YafQ family addiction module toxin component
MHDLEIRKSVDKIFTKLAKKNPKQLEIIFNKIQDIQEDPHRFKNLKRPLQHLKRVHIDKHFVLVFSIDEAIETVIIEDYEHHDKIYKI